MLDAILKRFDGSWQRWSRVYTELSHSQGRQVQPEVQTFLHRIFRLSTSIKIDDLLFTDSHLQEMRKVLFEKHKSETERFGKLQTYVTNSQLRVHVDDDIDRIRIKSNVCGLIILASSKLAHGLSFLLPYDVC